jgi:hypothetical protein
MTNPIERDNEIYKSLETIISNPEEIRKMDNEAVNATLNFCINRLNRFRMGGRSSALVGLSVLLWHLHERGTDIKIDVEECFSLAFRTAIDPSFVQPEWGIVLSGVLIARYLDRLPSQASAEIVRQCRLLLEHLEKDNNNLTTMPQAASALIQTWDADFPQGMNPVVKTCLAGWPETTSVNIIDKRRLEKLIDEMNSNLPANLSERQRKLYRLQLEQWGKWRQLEKVALG